MGELKKIAGATHVGREAKEALICTLMLASAADRCIARPEVEQICEFVRRSPLFDQTDEAALPEMAAAAHRFLVAMPDTDLRLKTLSAVLPDWLRPAAFGMAVEVVAADGRWRRAEQDFLDDLQRCFGVEPAMAAAIVAHVKHGGGRRPH